MPFRDDGQRARCCQILCERIGLGELWTDAGPTARALKLYRERAVLSTGEQALLLAAWAFWNPDGACGRVLRFGELLDVLDPEHVRALALLMISEASGPTDVDEWISVYGMPAAPASQRGIC